MANVIQKTIKRVAIIGGGPGGIAAARALRDEDAFDVITIFERNNHTGGTWCYSPERNPPPPFPSTDALKVDTTLELDQLHSPIYANLHTNLPHSVMCFQDAPFPKNTPDFPSHTHVMDYLSELAKNENLLPCIRFSTLVEKAVFENDVWKVSVKNDKEAYTAEFDALVVATGHYAVPYVPDIPGLETLALNKKIQLLHSRDYRRPEEFKGKTILVIGGGSSAIDIVRETSTVATKVYQCIRTQTELSRQAVERNPPNVHQVALVNQFSVDDTGFPCIELQDDTKLANVDVVVFGTGYLYSFPFLPFQKDNLIKTGQKVHHLTQYMFYQNNPTLCFLGLPIRVVPLPLMQRQSIVMARYWSGRIPMLPPTSEESSSADDNDNRLEFIMGVAKEFDYDERLGAWAEGWTDADREGWQSDHPVTGRLSEKWKDLRKNALSLRREYLGY
ncbi:uncharacterized protein ATC70_003435 [Mucor velutinosus]|uniref:Flavin-containing monooxygenase n=1 Tax=Mucor velutinosus TaxID=708070 RepID=A0AAN7DA32_9FUNG|nr:hypothetical protein ATC70_003435 [Mucor velutinosus]